MHIEAGGVLINLCSRVGGSQGGMGALAATQATAEAILAVLFPSPLPAFSNPSHSPSDGVPDRGSLTMSSPGLVGQAGDPHVGSPVGHIEQPMAYERKVPEDLPYTPRY